MRAHDQTEQTLTWKQFQKGEMLQYNWCALTEIRKYSLKRKLNLLTLSYAGREPFWPPSGFSSPTPGVISRGCWNLVTFSQTIWDIIWWKKNFQLSYCFHMATLLFMSAQPILSPFLWVLVQTTRNRKVSAQSCDFFCHFQYFSTFLVQNSVQKANFQFSTDFHKYTLNMTSYHVTEAINSYV